MTGRLQANRRTRTAAAGACAFLLLGIGSTQATHLAPPAVIGSVVFSTTEGAQCATLGTCALSSASGSLQFTTSGTPSPSVVADATIIPFFFGRASGLLV